MSFKVSFLDGQVCGVDDFNALLGDIVQEGVVTDDFDATSAYQMSKLNVVYGNGKISQGVAASETSLSCTMGTGGVYVAPGLGIFGSGAKIKVTESEFVECDDVDNVYVYAYHDKVNNMAGVKSSGEGFPAEVDGELYVLKLCSVVGGVFTDERGYAKANVKACDTFNATKKMEMVTPGRGFDEQEIVLEVGGDQINFLVIKAKTGSHDMWIVEEPEYGVFEIYKGGRGTPVTTIWFSDYVGFTGFRRGENGELLVTHIHASGGAVCKYTLYASVCEEVSE